MKSSNIYMKKSLNAIIAIMVFLAPLSSFDISDNLNRSSIVTFFGSQVDDDCDNETKDDDLPYFVNKENGSDDNSGSVDCPFASIAKAAEAMEDGDTVVISVSYTHLRAHET